MLRPLLGAFWGSYNYYPLHCVTQYKRGKSLLNMDQWVDVNLFPFPQAENTVKQNSPIPDCIVKVRPLSLVRYFSMDQG